MDDDGWMMVIDMNEPKRTNEQTNEKQEFSDDRHSVCCIFEIVCGIYTHTMFDDFRLTVIFSFCFV